MGVDIGFDAADNILFVDWVRFLINESHKLISFINLTNNSEDYWNEGKLQPSPVEGIMVWIQIDGPVKHVFTASPDIEMGRHSVEPKKYRQGSKLP
ncbi:hypothetical protein GC098_02165 [Paenibacillus sp. LMG 31458]|uniref:Uncharacterized protein n=1 Tax=Paenibacillus phytorum TaxID=2654977 RepID=A0ABX1XPR4_9BACL|nr:glycoside hydrolase family 66 protein [Paenibacillus phytorum]NOU70254.1 hypothetical protein [Paenibacillus phytorum]